MSVIKYDTIFSHVAWFYFETENICSFILCSHVQRIALKLNKRFLVTESHLEIKWKQADFRPVIPMSSQNKQKQGVIRILLKFFWWHFHLILETNSHYTVRAPLYTAKSIELSAPQFKGLNQSLLASTYVE